MKRLDHLNIPTGLRSLPIEISIIGDLPAGTGRQFVECALSKQQQHSQFLDEYNEPSALIARTDFARGDHTAIYTFGVDRREHVFHRHAGHRAITGVTGAKGCMLQFSLSRPEDIAVDVKSFFEQMHLVTIAPDRMFSLRFSGTTYHRFAPLDCSENGFFAVSVHTDEACGLSGELLNQVLADGGTIPLLTEPVSATVLQILLQPDAFQLAKTHVLGTDLP